MSFVVIIPARHASSRLPGKMLEHIHGKAMIAHVVERSLTSGASRTIVATDYDAIGTAACEAGAEVCMTRQCHQSGTERLVEAIDHLGLPDDTIVVNVQGDEPLVQPSSICRLARFLALGGRQVATLASPITSEDDADNPNVVKVVLDGRENALYFSRAPIPWKRGNDRDCGRGDAAPMLRHLGLYAYRAGFLREYSRLKPTELENIESLEQLRILWHGFKIAVCILQTETSISVDTADDLERVRRLPEDLFTVTK